MRERDEEPTILKDAWQEGIAEDARANGFIALDHLGYILAKDEQYIEHLPCLWEHYELNMRGSAKPDVSTPRARVGTWLKILYRWAFGTVAGSTAGLKLIPRIMIHGYDDETGGLEKLTSGPAYVTLESIGNYFTKYVKIPLPKLLFPPKVEQAFPAATGMSDIEYAFINRGKVWTIIFNQMQTDGYKGDGFLILHHLVQNINKEYSVSDLSAITGVNPDDIGKQKVKPDGRGKEEGDAFEEGEERMGVETLYELDTGMDEKALTAIRKEMASLREQLEDAKESFDYERADEVKDKIEGLGKYAIAQQYRLKPAIHKETDRIGRSIRRAIDEISKYDPAAGAHFKKAIGKLYAGKKSYRPEKPLDWKFF